MTRCALAGKCGFFGASGLTAAARASPVSSPVSLMRAASPSAPMPAPQRCSISRRVTDPLSRPSHADIAFSLPDSNRLLSVDEYHLVTQQQHLRILLPRRQRRGPGLRLLPRCLPGCFLDEVQAQRFLLRVGGAAVEEAV